MTSVHACLSVFVALQWFLKLQAATCCFKEATCCFKEATLTIRLMFNQRKLNVKVNHCFLSGKVQLEKPLHVVIGTVTPTSVILSWGTLLKTPYEGNIMNDCLEDG